MASTSALLQWQAPEFLGAPITGYIINVRRDIHAPLDCLLDRMGGPATCTFAGMHGSQIEALTACAVAC